MRSCIGSVFVAALILSVRFSWCSFSCLKQTYAVLCILDSPVNPLKAVLSSAPGDKDILYFRQDGIHTFIACVHEVL